MRFESSVTSISWIPSEAVAGAFKVSFDLGVTHYDDPLPDRVDDLEALRVADRFRFANELRAFIDVEGGAIAGCGYTGRGHIGATTMRLGVGEMTFAAAALPDLQQPPEIGDGFVRFVQTAGGRTGAPMPRKVNHPPFVQLTAPLAWTTLSLTIHADGTSSHELIGASAFPRPWSYDSEGRLSHKSGIVDFKQWAQHAFGRHSPCGDEDSPALVTEVETALERELSTHIMRGGAKPRISTVEANTALVSEGDVGRDVFLVLDGVISVEVGGEPLAQAGPGAVLGERALLETGARTATLRAVTRCRVASIDGRDIDPVMLAELAAGHRREEATAQ